MPRLVDRCRVIVPRKLTTGTAVRVANAHVDVRCDPDREEVQFDRDDVRPFTWKGTTEKDGVILHAKATRNAEGARLVFYRYVHRDAAGKIIRFEVVQVQRNGRPLARKYWRQWW